MNEFLNTDLIIWGRVINRDHLPVLIIEWKGIEDKEEK